MTVPFRRRAPIRLLVPAAILAAALWYAGGSDAATAETDTIPAASTSGGLDWTFVRVRYSSWPALRAQYLRDYRMEPWAVDAPVAEENLARRVRSVTSIQVNDPITLTLTDPGLWLQPWIYLVEPGTLRLTEEEVSTLREFLLRGGTLTFDDFHGEAEWANMEREMRRVFPDRPIEELAPDHPVYSSFYEIDSYPQIPGLGSFFRGRMWEKGGYRATLSAISDDQGRAMVLINFNTDMGDGWEWSNAEDYPGYLPFTARAYQMMINQIVYALTH
ncbi:MAG: DUF4159 domain-containing protein [Vicinamibacterales bacterium]|nr:DUF4159 domain-containing protein [Vicinamibacterales bacterium]